jgi:hypothetical protein
MRLLLSCAVLLVASRGANAACLISGAKPTVPLPTMELGQDFSFVASRDCVTLRFMIRGTTLAKNPRSGGPVGPGPNTYKVVLTESEWNAVVAETGSTVTWIVTGRTSTGVITRMVTTNELTVGGGVTMSLSMADAEIDGGVWSVSGAGDVDGDGRDDLLLGDIGYGAYLVLGPVTGTLDRSRADATLLHDYAGGAVSGAGDVDGDGHDDLLVGEGFVYIPSGTDAAAAYLVLGPVSESTISKLRRPRWWGGMTTTRATASRARDVDDDGRRAGGREQRRRVPRWWPTVLGPSRGPSSRLGRRQVRREGPRPGGLLCLRRRRCGCRRSRRPADRRPAGAAVATRAAYLVLGPVTGTMDLPSPTPSSWANTGPTS